MDGLNNTTVASTTVPINSDITAWLNSLKIPVHEGYRFSKFTITVGSIHKVTDDATVYITYSVEGGGGNPGEGQTVDIFTTLLNKREIAINSEALHGISGSATVQVQFSKGLDTLTYSSCEVNEYDGSESEEIVKSDVSISNDVVSFTDTDCSKHRFYIFKFYDSNRKDIGPSLWNDGLYPIRISFTIDGAQQSYSIRKMQN